VYALPISVVPNLLINRANIGDKKSWWANSGDKKSWQANFGAELNLIKAAFSTKTTF
jgi:hypothetical protein